MTRTRTALAAGALALAALGPTAAPAFAGTPAPAVATPPAHCTVENGCRLIVNPAFPGSPGTAAVPEKGLRPLTLEAILGSTHDDKWPIVQWRSRYTDVWNKNAHWHGFQSGAVNTFHKAVSVYAQCGDKDSQKNGGDWTNPVVWIGSGGGRVVRQLEEQVDLRNAFVCDGRLRLVIPSSYWRTVNCGYNQPNRRCYFDIKWPAGETAMLVQADDDSWLQGLVR